MGYKISLEDDFTEEKSEKHWEDVVSKGKEKEKLESKREVFPAVWGCLVAV